MTTFDDEMPDGVQQDVDSGEGPRIARKIPAWKRRLPDDPDSASACRWGDESPNNPD